MAKVFQMDIVVEHGQLHEGLRDPADRKLMRERLDRILTDPDIGTGKDPQGEKKALRDGVVQVLIDQLKNNNGHEPLIIQTLNDDGDEEQIAWNCEHAEIEVSIDKYRKTDRTPHPGPPIGGPAKNPFRFNKGGDKGKHVESGDYKDKKDSKLQKYYKFSLKGKDHLDNDIELDPCIICEK